MALAKITHVRTLIVGGGITGLGTAYALEQQADTDYLIVEQQDHVGGLCRSGTDLHVLACCCYHGQKTEDQRKARL